jgi:heat shock protein HslJ/uncharacterized lipoprotein YbaY
MRINPFFFRLIIGPVLLLLMLAGGCNRDNAETTRVESGEKTLTISGTLSYRQRMALPAHSVVIIELHRHADSRQAQCTVRRLAETRFDPGEQQVPIDYSLTVNRDRIIPTCRHSLVGAIKFAGGTHWISAPTPIATYSSDIDQINTGVLLLRQHQPRLFASHMICGDQPVLAYPEKTHLRVKVNDRDFTLSQVVAATGAKYIAMNDETTSFWNKGYHATLTVAGEDYPGCTVMSARLPLEASGHEPAWSLSMTEEILQLRGLDTRFNVDTTTPQTMSTARGHRYRAQTGERELIVDVAQNVCTDSMSGMPYPLRVEVQIDNESLRGCGGDPAWILTAGVWVVEDIDRDGIVDRSRITMDFRPDGTVAGFGGCNSYRANWQLNGESIGFSQPTATLKSCAPSLNDQEQRFLKLLSGTVRLHIDETSALVFYTPEEQTVKARLQ